MFTRLRVWSRAFRALTVVAIFNLGAAWFSWVHRPWMLLCYRAEDETRRRIRCQQLNSRGLRWLVRLMVRLDLIQVELPAVPASFDNHRRYMIVANHPSLIDVMLIKATLPGVVCLVKSSVFHAPHVSGMLQGTGDFPGPSGKPEIGTTQVLDLLVEKLESGLHVLAFPEGTRSPPGGLRRFRRGASEAAIRAGATILPICITCDPPAFLKGQSWFAQAPETPRLTLRFLDEIATEGRSSPELTAELRALFGRELGLNASGS